MIGNLGLALGLPLAAADFWFFAYILLGILINAGAPPLGGYESSPGAIRRV